MKGYSAFPKAPALLEPPHQIVQCHIQDTRWWGGVLSPSRDEVGVFCRQTNVNRSGERQTLRQSVVKIKSLKFGKKINLSHLSCKHNKILIIKYVALTRISRSENERYEKLSDLGGFIFSNLSQRYKMHMALMNLDSCPLGSTILTTRVINKKNVLSIDSLFQSSLEIRMF